MAQSVSDHLTYKGIDTMNLITEEFQGADLERLNDCIKAIHKAGLRIGKHTQAGINQSSGKMPCGKQILFLKRRRAEQRVHLAC